MNDFKTLLFPDTDLSKDRLYPLFLFFAPIHYLKPIESSPGDEEKSECDIFMDKQLCQAHTPAPLGKNRERFLRLANDIAERQDDNWAL